MIKTISPLSSPQGSDDTQNRLWVSGCLTQSVSLNFEGSCPGEQGPSFFLRFSILANSGTQL
jgi:hypothetical protein